MNYKYTNPGVKKTSLPFPMV